MSHLTAADVAALWGCSTRKVADTARAAGVGIQLAGRAGWRFTASDVAAMEAHLKPAAIPARRRRRGRAA